MGEGFKIETPLTGFSKIVYFNGNNPNSATIFSTTKTSPLVNDTEYLKNNDDYLYIGEDNNTWLSNGGGYDTFYGNKDVPSILIQKKNLTTTLNSGNTLNLFSLINLNTDVVSIDGVPITDWSIVTTTKALKFPNIIRRIKYDIRVSLKGSFSGNPNASHNFILTIERANTANPKVIGGAAFYINNAVLDRVTQLLTTTYTKDSINDEFISNGVVANVSQSTGQTLTINTIEILIQGYK